MNHAILGAGGIGGLIGAVLAHKGDRVTMLLRPESVAHYPDHLWLETPAGEIKAPVHRTVKLEAPVDVLWIAVKAHQLDSALRSLGAETNGVGTVVPLLNGIDHVALLRSRFGRENVVPGTIAVEAERVAPGHIVQRSPFVRMALSAQGEAKLGGIAGKFRETGFTCDFYANEQTMLWGKLAFLAPFALTSTAADKSIGEIFADAQWRARLESAVREACAVANAEGASLDSAKILATLGSLPPAMRSSMQKDVKAGRVPELDAIGGPIVRGGSKHHIEHSVTRELMEKIEQRLNPSK